MNTMKTLLEALIACPSITPMDADCQSIMIQFLQNIGFDCERLDAPPVNNFFARFGQSAPLLVFAGHTDVVPVGDATQWHTDPFILHEKAGIAYGRGTADMKGSLASMLIAAERFTKEHNKPVGSLGFLITSGEEGDDYARGTPYVMQQLQKKGIHIDYCIVGEPSSTQRIADTIKIGRRGSLNGILTLQGKQGHVAYPQFAINPIHAISPVLQILCTKEWDKGNAYFPPTSFQVTSIHAGSGTHNIIPGEIKIHFNFRYSTEYTAKQLVHTVETYFKDYGLTPSIQWQLSGEPFLSSQGALLDACINCIVDTTAHKPELSTSGGTSDGRFIAPYGTEVIELGPVNASIHQVNEHISLADLETLADIYYQIAKTLLCKL